MEDTQPQPPTAIPHWQLLEVLERHNAVRDLHRRLARATRGAQDPRRAFATLVHADPAGALDWLLADDAAARAALGEAQAPPLLRLVTEEALRREKPWLDVRLVELAHRFSDLLAPDALAAIAARIPAEKRATALAGVLRRLLDRAPTHAGLLRLAAETARAQADPASAHRFLTRLGRADPGQATVQYVARARAKLAAADGPRVRIALLGSYTLDPLVPWVDLECRDAGLVPEFYLAPFDTWEQEVRSERSGLRGFGPEAAFLAVAVDDLVPGLAGALPDEALLAAGAEAVERVATAARLFRESSDALLVVHGFHSAHRDPRGVAAGREGLARGAWLAELNAQLRGRLAEVPRAYLLDMAELLVHRADGALESPKLRHYARMRLGERVLPEVARAYARFVVPLKGLAKKCVVLDLDNTLWGGVVGEDGVHGIRLGDTSPGAEYVEFQRYLRALPERGFLLAVVSKNNEADALEAIRAHEAMVLREDAFSARRINWLPKHENVLSIAAELGIGVESMVFVDDNPDERELMRQMLPEVLTVELPADPALYRAALETLPQLQTLEVTEADRTRAEQYRARRDREQTRVSAPSLEDYYHSLEIAVEVAPASEATLSRVHQLVQRTNQFNLTTRRYDAAQLAGFAADAGWRVLAARARDRFGDHGLVAAAVVEAGAGRWRIDSLLMSCRVIGYGVETALLAAVAEAARGAGAAVLEGEYVETARNQPARDFYPRHGFTAAESGGGGERWERRLSDGGIAAPAWISMTVRHAS